MIRHRTAGLTALVAATLVAAPLAAQEEFNWRGRIASGRTLEIKGINGSIRAVAATGSEARVSALKTARRSDVDEVEIEVLEHARGITICAVYPSRRDREANECAPGDEGRMNTRDNDVKVDFVVEVPDGVTLTARTVNGSIDADGIAGDVRAHTVNGSISVGTAGFAEATTVNGSIDVVMNGARFRDDLEFQTVNGGITVTFSGDVNADVDAQTVNGSIGTDYPLTVRGRFGPKRLTGTIGGGGPGLSLNTVNGDIEIRRR
jgi:DUF4097 and DUF4098 domain-containing protein YvlB